MAKFVSKKENCKPEKVKVKVNLLTSKKKRKNKLIFPSQMINIIFILCNRKNIFKFSLFNTEQSNVDINELKMSLHLM